jgi:CubicO group peptidase (beta-lactamase class C family)
MTNSTGQAVTGVGHVAPGFEAVRDAFEANFTERGDIGAAMNVHVDGREVVDLHAGEARDGVPWAADTLVCGMSTVKPVLATALAILVDRGQLDLDAPIADYWPEFAANGKERVTAAHVVTHTAGLPWFPDYANVVTLDDPTSFARREEIATALAAAPPQWEPGTQIGSHSITVGWLVAEIVQRAGGVEIGRFIREEIAEPLGGECWIGLPPEHHARVAEATMDEVYDSDALAEFMNPATPQGKALLLGPERRLGTAMRMAINDPTYREAGSPATASFLTARTLARIYAMLVGGGELDGVRILSPEQVAAFTTIRQEGTDALFSVRMRLSAGFLHESEDINFGGSDQAFGFPGQGGQLAFGDPAHGVAFSYLPGLGAFLQGRDPRAVALTDAVYEALGAR